MAAQKLEDRRGANLADRDTSQFKHLQDRPTLQRLPVPEVRPALRSTRRTNYLAGGGASLDLASLRGLSQDKVKISKFNGGRGFPCPEEVEHWLRAVTRAVKANGWNAKEVLEKVQAKLTGVAATWHQTRGALF